LESGVINAREVAGAGRLVLFGAEGERVDIDTSAGVASVVLVRLDEVEVGTFTLGEAVLTVELQLGSDNGILTPAVHVKGSLRYNKGHRVSDGGGRLTSLSEGGTEGINILEHIIMAGGTGAGKVGADKRTGLGSSDIGEVKKRRSQYIKIISVVKGLGTKQLVEILIAGQRLAIVDIGVTLNNPYKFLARVVEVELNLVRRRTNGFITSELKLFNEVFVGVLGHTAALISVEEDIIDIEGSGDKGLLVSSSDLGRVDAWTTIRALVNGVQALIDRAQVEVNLNFVVLEGDQRQSKTGVAAIPELEGNIESGFG